MLRLVLSAALLLVMPAGTMAQVRLLPFGSPKPNAKTAARAAEHDYDELAQQAKAADEDFQRRLEQAPSEQARQQLSRERPDFSPEFERLAERYRGSPTGLKALVWLCRFGPQASVERYVDMIVADYLESEQLVDAIRATAPFAGRVAAAPKLYRAALTGSPHRDVRGLACYYLAYSCVPEPDFGAISRQREAEAVSLLERVVDEFGDVPSYRGRLGALATGGLNAIEHLKVGKQAPEIEGSDVFHRKLKLSDYRGQVVVVAFWADWCGPCRQDYAHHRALAKQFADRPFALLGVNGDPPENLKQVLKRERMSWPCWADGPAGPISASWSVGMWPTTYVLDARGVVRYRAVAADQLQRLVAGLLGDIDSDGQQRASR